MGSLIVISFVKEENANNKQLRLLVHRLLNQLIRCRRKLKELFNT